MEVEDGEDVDSNTGSASFLYYRFSICIVFNTSFKNRNLCAMGRGWFLFLVYGPLG